MYSELPNHRMPAFLPSFVGSETLYSWGARFHLLSGNLRATKSSRDLFANSYAGLRPDFPFCLDQFNAQTGGLMGDPVLIAQERTLLGYFAPFQSKQLIDTIVAQMRGPSKTSLKSQLGLLASRVGAAHPLKACLKCVKSEMLHQGFSMWHIEHQWPSVWICAKHQCGLACLKRHHQPRDLRQWLLPDQLSSQAWQKTVFPYGSLARLTKLTNFTYDVIHRSALLDPEILRQAYFLALERHGWISTDGSMRFKILRTEFLQYYRRLECIPGFESITGAQCEHGGLLGLLMRQYGGTRHPLKHFLLLSFLFSQPEEFFSIYSQLRLEMDNLKAVSFRQRISQDWQSKLKHLVEQENMSVSAASDRLQVPLPQAIRFARSIDLKYTKKPRVLTPKLDERLHELARKGLTQQQMAEALGIKKSFVRSYLAEHGELRELWRACVQAA